MIESWEKGAQTTGKGKQRKKYSSSDATSVPPVRSDDLQSHLQSKLLPLQLRRRQVRDFQAFHFESHLCRSVCETLNKLQSGCLVLEQVFTKAGRLNMQSMSASAYHSNILYLLCRPPSHRLINTFWKGERKAMQIVHFFFFFYTGLSQLARLLTRYDTVLFKKKKKKKGCRKENKIIKKTKKLGQVKSQLPVDGREEVDNPSCNTSR